MQANTKRVYGTDGSAVSPVATTSALFPGPWYTHTNLLDKATKMKYEQLKTLLEENESIALLFRIDPRAIAILKEKKQIYDHQEEVKAVKFKDVYDITKGRKHDYEQMILSDVANVLYNHGFVSPSYKDGKTWRPGEARFANVPVFNKPEKHQWWDHYSLVEDKDGKWSFYKVASSWIDTIYSPVITVGIYNAHLIARAENVAVVQAVEKAFRDMGMPSFFDPSKIADGP
jgi:hypothetical protein